MAKLTVLPDARTIVEAKGVVDFYYWKGIPCARKWPRKASYERSAAEQAGSARFTTVAKATTGISTVMKELWIGIGASEGTTWVDVFRNNGLGGEWLEDGN